MAATIAAAQQNTGTDAGRSPATPDIEPHVPPLETRMHCSRADPQRCIVAMCMTCSDAAITTVLERRRWIRAVAGQAQAIVDAGARGRLRAPC